MGAGEYRLGPGVRRRRHLTGSAWLALYSLPAQQSSSAVARPQRILLTSRTRQRLAVFSNQAVQARWRRAVTGRWRKIISSRSSMAEISIRRRQSVRSMMYPVSRYRRCSWLEKITDRLGLPRGSRDITGSRGPILTRCASVTHTQATPVAATDLIPVNSAVLTTAATACNRDHPEMMSTPAAASPDARGYSAAFRH